jgi:hypothetical protein
MPGGESTYVVYDDMDESLIYPVARILSTTIPSEIIVFPGLDMEANTSGSGLRDDEKDDSWRSVTVTVTAPSPAQAPPSAGDINDNNRGGSDRDRMMEGLVIGGAVLPGLFMAAVGVYLWRQRARRVRNSLARKDAYRREVRQRTEELLSESFAEDRKTIIAFHQQNNSGGVINPLHGERTATLAAEVSRDNTTLNPLHLQSVYAKQVIESV